LSRRTGPTASQYLRQTFVFLRRIIGKRALWVAFALMCLVFGLLEPRFLSIDNIWNVLRQTAPLLVTSIGQAVVIIGGGFDLSVGSIAAVSGIVMVYGVWSLGTIPGIMLALGSGVGIGLINGFSIARWNLNPFILTLGTMMLFRGLAYFVTGGLSLFGNIPPGMLILGNGHIGPVPIPVIIGIIGVVILAVLLRRTTLGRHSYAVGGNREAARLAGIDTSAVTIKLYAISGFFAALTGVILSARLGVATPTLGGDLNLESIAAVVIGGVSISGGEGTAMGVLLGTLILGIVRNGLNLYRVSMFIQMMITGVIIATAVLVDRLRSQ